MVNDKLVNYTIIEKQESKYAQLSASVAVNQHAKSIYLLHVMNGGGTAGWMTFHYEDGTSQKQFVVSGQQVNGWYFPKDVPYSRNTGWTCKTAWKGHNGNVQVGVYAWGVDNPQPDKTIKKISFHHLGQNNSWLILGITISNQPKFFEPPAITRHYVNTGWNAGTFLSAIIEGIGGIKNDGLAYDKVTVSPKWYFADEKEVTMTARLPASDGYVRYRYLHHNNNMELLIAASADQSYILLPVPPGKTIQKLTINNQMSQYRIINQSDSRYAKISVEAPVLHHVELIFN